IELIYTVIRNMVRELNNVSGLVIPESFSPYLKKGHKNETIYKTKSTEESSKLESLIQQAHELYEWVQEQSVALDTDAFKHLSRLINKQSVKSEDGIVVQIEDKKISARILQNPTDPNATFRTKGDIYHSGLCLNLVEVHDPKKEIGLIMHAELKENTQSD